MGHIRSASVLAEASVSVRGGVLKLLQLCAI
jgi:hypothetical protein